MNIGIDHGYSAVKTRHFSFPAGISAYSYEPYTLQNTLEYGGQYFVCGTSRGGIEPFTFPTAGAVLYGPV